MGFAQNFGGEPVGSFYLAAIRIENMLLGIALIDIPEYKNTGQGSFGVKSNTVGQGSLAALNYFFPALAIEIFVNTENGSFKFSL